MNIILWGSMGSGKTLLANMLAKHYTEHGQTAQILEDRVIGPSSLDFGRQVSKTTKLLERTLDNPVKHTIITTQALPETIYRFYDSKEGVSLFNYYYHTIWKIGYHPNLKEVI